jgi:hypothetical protein
VDLTSEGNVAIIEYLHRLQNVYDSFRRTRPGQVQPGLQLKCVEYTADVVDTMHYVGQSGAQEFHVEILGLPTRKCTYSGFINHPGPFPSTPFRPDTFHFLNVLYLENFGADLALYMGTLLQQEFVHTLHLGGRLFSSAYLDYLLHSLNMPRLESMSVEGVLSRQHFYQAMLRHSRVRSLTIGIMSMWLEGRFPLRLPDGIMLLAGPEVMIAELAVHTKLLGVRRLLLKCDLACMCWCMDSINQIFKVASASDTLSKVAFEVDDNNFDDLNMGWGKDTKWPKSIEDIYIVQEQGLYINETFLVCGPPCILHPLLMYIQNTVNSFAHKLPTSVQVTAVGSVLPGVSNTFNVQVLAWTRWDYEWNCLSDNID